MEIEKYALISDCGTYRYSLTRIWNRLGRRVVFIGLNPSTADAEVDDATIRVCIGYAKRWGYGSIEMVNLFSYRATKPNIMKYAKDPVGPMNDSHLRISTNQIVNQQALYVAAWGNHGAFNDRDKYVRKMFPELYYLKLNKSGQPCHPLYNKAYLVPTLWEYEDAN